MSEAFIVPLWGVTSVGTKIRKEVGKAFSESQHFITVDRAVLCPAHERACLQLGADPWRTREPHSVIRCLENAFLTKYSVCLFSAKIQTEFWNSLRNLSVSVPRRRTCSVRVMTALTGLDFS